MIATVERLLRKHTDVESTTYILAISMGVDSAVLLEIFYRLGHQVHAVHFNHNKRLTSKQEEEAFLNYCQQRNIKATAITVPELSGNFQNQARQFRYQELKQIASQYDHGVIVTGHHLDDQIETYIQRLFTGSRFINRRGMCEYNIYNHHAYFRPFIKFEKEALYTAANDSNILFFEDQSNTDNVYTRNQIRNQLVPQLANIFPKYKQNIQEDINEARQLTSYFDQQLAVFFQTYVTHEDDLFSIDQEAFNAVHPYMQGLVLERCVKDLGFSLKRVQYEMMKQYARKRNKKVYVKDTLSFTAFTQQIRIEKIADSQNTKEDYAFFLKDSSIKLPNPYKLWYNDKNNGYDDVLEIYQEDLPFLNVRNHRKGDRVLLNTHHKRVSRIFIDAKLPQEKRSTYPLIEDIRTKQIIWIPMMYKSYKRNINEKTVQIYFTDGGFHAR